jgi:hypothetical protein
MNRRLFFLLPDEQHARQAMQDLIDAGIHKNAVSAHQRHSRDNAGEIASGKVWQRVHRAEQVEAWAWRTDLVIFFLALIGLGFALWYGSVLFSVVAVVIMALTFLVGDRFAELVPRVHLQEFEHALSHGEVLLMVDVQSARVAEIENLLLGKHPEAIAGGSSWTLRLLGI